MKGERDAPARIRTGRMVAVFLFVVAAFVVLAYGQQQQNEVVKRLDSLVVQGAGLNDRDACTRRVLTELVQSQADESAAGAAAWALVLSPGTPVPEAEAREAFQAYLTATEASAVASQRFVDLSRELAEHGENPVLDVADIAACR